MEAAQFKAAIAKAVLVLEKNGCKMDKILNWINDSFTLGDEENCANKDRISS